MNLGLCIANLLKRHEAVEVPGIGVFKVIHTHARYDEAEQIILPPARLVELSPREVGGFPITAYLRAQQRVDEAKARQLLGRAVADIMETMSRNGRVLLDGLGYLLADGAALVLTPFETGGLDWKPIKVTAPAVKGDVGMSDLETIDPQDTDAALVEDAEVIEVIETSEVNETVETVAVLDVTEPEGITQEPTHTYEATAVEATAVVEASSTDTPAMEERRGGTRVWGWIAAVAAIFVLATTWAWYQKPEWLERIGITRFLAAAPGELADGDVQPPVAQLDAIVADSIPEAGQTAAVDAATTDSVTTLAPTADSVVTPPPSKPAVTYEIIVGSFATMAQADKYVAQMKAKGYELQAIDSRMPGNRKKISWGSYATEEEAYRELARVQKNFEPGAWIAKVDNRE